MRNKLNDPVNDLRRAIEFKSTARSLVPKDREVQRRADASVINGCIGVLFAFGYRIQTPKTRTQKVPMRTKAKKVARGRK